MKPTVLADPIPEQFSQATASQFDLQPLDTESDEILSSATAILTYGQPLIDGAFLERCLNVRVISNHGVGVDHIDLAAAKARGISVGNTPGCLDAATADMTMALLLSTARNVVMGDRFSRGLNAATKATLIGHEVTGSTLGIIGMGRIGGEVAKRARAFDMRVLYFNRNRRAEMEKGWGVEWVPLRDLLRECDFVTLNCPLTTETTGLIGHEEFAHMKSSAILINMARGPVVQTKALDQALRDGSIAAAGLDVTDPEPLPEDHPLLQLENVVVTPHLGSASNRTRRQMLDIALVNLRAGLAGEELPWSVV